MSIQNETKARRIWERWQGASEAHTRSGLQRASNGRDYGDEDGNFRTLIFEILECGHRQLPKRDFVGETNAYKRRCRKCGGNHEPTRPR